MSQVPFFLLLGDRIGGNENAFVYTCFFNNFVTSVKRFAFLWQTEGEEDDSYDDPMNVVPKTPQS